MNSVSGGRVSTRRGGGGDIATLVAHQSVENLFTVKLERCDAKLLGGRFPAAPPPEPPGTHVSLRTN